MHSEMPLLGEIVKKLVGDLISVRGSVQQHHVAFLKRLVQRLIMRGLDQQEWARRLRAAYSLLDHTFNLHPEIMAPLVFEIIEAQGHVQMEAANLEEQIKANEDSRTPDARFTPVLGLYSALYEGTYPTLVAPFVRAHSLDQPASRLSNAIGPDGRVKPPKVEELEDERGLPRGLLTQGLHRHLRNAVAHRRYTIHSRDEIEMEDRNPQGNLTWGPERLSYSELRRWADDLQTTCLALRAALVIFDINKQQLAVERGFVVPSKIQPRFDVVEAILRSVASSYGFEVRCASDETADEFTLHLKVIGETSVGQSQIFAQHAHGYAKYTQESKTVHPRARHQVFRLVAQTADMYEAYRRIRVHVENWDGKQIGHIVLDEHSLIDLEKASGPEDPVRLEEDTLGEVRIPVTLKSRPKLVERRRGKVGPDEIPEALLREIEKRSDDSEGGDDAI